MKRGRPKKDNSDLIGIIFNKLKIIRIMKRNDKSGHPMCRTKCLECKKESTQRLHDVKIGKSKTCGCGSKTAFKNFMNNRVAAMADDQIERIWCVVQDTGTFQKAARTLRMGPDLVSFAFREHQRRLDTLPDSKKLVIWKAAQESGFDAATTKLGLSRKSAKYIVLQFHKPRVHPALDDGLEQVLSYMKMDIERRPEKEEPWFRSGEFSQGQLMRKTNGQVEGWYKEMYQDLVRCPKSPMLNPELAKLIEWFLETAEKTFANRRKRQRQFLETMRKEASEKRELERRAILVH
jgi:hypothetical protein